VVEAHNGITASLRLQGTRQHYMDRNGVHMPVGYRRCDRLARPAAAIALMRFMAPIAERAKATFAMKDSESRKKLSNRYQWETTDPRSLHDGDTRAAFLKALPYFEVKENERL
jgi:hypothetical protein